jgi:IgGFc binding protein
MKHATKRNRLFGLGLGGAASALLSVLAGGACGSTENGFGKTSSGGASSGGLTSGGFSSSGFVDPDGGGNGSCTFLCSADLHTVLNCDNTPRMRCGDNEGCGADGKCVPACESAAANKTSIGCNYHAINPNPPPSIAPPGPGGCFAAYVANTWGTPMSISVSRGNTMFDIGKIARIPVGTGSGVSYQPLPGGKLPPNQVAILFLAGAAFHVAPCPAGITPALAKAEVDGTGIGEAFRIDTSAPAVAYDIYPFGGGNSVISSATLLLPVGSWDTNYIAVNPYKASARLPTFSKPNIQISASENGTEVTLAPVSAIEGGPGVKASPAKQPAVYMLNKGQYLQLAQASELTGSVVRSNKPVGMWGGQNLLDVPADVGVADGSHQQIPPVRALGSEYVGVRYRNRVRGNEETPPWRMVGVVEGTRLVWDPAPPAGAPSELKLGQVAEFASAGEFNVKSQDQQHPFYMAQYMTGSDTPTLMGAGDPEFVNMIPPEQYMLGYLFFTDPTYPETNLVFIRKKGKDGFSDVTLDCKGKLGGWVPIGKNGIYEYTRVDLSTGDFKGVGGCDNGRHEAKSEGLFGVTVWGWGNEQTGSTAVSYAYPAGAAIRPINPVIVYPTPN